MNKYKIYSGKGKAVAVRGDRGFGEGKERSGKNDN
jgi:hypothetical protein